jgi:AbrB family looped-hinge helix DNA binding protein
MYARVSSKGQITIPKNIRKKLNLKKESGVPFLIENDEIKLKGIPGLSADQLAGSLKKYARGYVPLKKVRKEIQERVADEIAGEDLSR